MITMTTSVEAYLKAVNKALPCSYHTRRALIRGLREELTEFADNNCNPSFAQLCDTFGSPKEAAAQLMEGLDPDELLRVRRNHRIILGFVVVLLLTVVVYWYAEWRNAQQIIDDAPFYIVEYPAITVEIPDDESIE